MSGMLEGNLGFSSKSSETFKLNSSIQMLLHHKIPITVISNCHKKIMKNANGNNKRQSRVNYTSS